MPSEIIGHTEPLSFFHVQLGISPMISLKASVVVQLFKDEVLGTQTRLPGSNQDIARAVGLVGNVSCNAQMVRQLRKQTAA